MFNFTNTISRQTEVRVLAEERERSEQQRRSLELRRLRHEQREVQEAVGVGHESADERRRDRAERLQLFLRS